LITAIDWDAVPDFDLFTYSFPCTDISNAGDRKGLAEGSGTRSSLLWECRRAIRTKRPKWLLMENVRALVNKHFAPAFHAWQAELESYEYANFTKMLNARDYGVPQHRERIFMVSARDCDTPYFFPKPMPLERRVRDIVEEPVGSEYTLSFSRVQHLVEHDEKYNHTGFHGNYITGGGRERHGDNHVR
jgi:DNA (cytosine-5)-methyltransferase 1